MVHRPLVQLGGQPSDSENGRGFAAYSSLPRLFPVHAVSGAAKFDNPAGLDYKAAPMELNRRQVCYLRGLAHPLNPRVQMGKGGYGVPFVSEVSRNLKDHELVKIRMATDDRAEFYQLSEQLAQETEATLVQTIGRTVVLYREGDEPKIKIPKN